MAGILDGAFVLPIIPHMVPMVDAAKMADRAEELAGGHGADTIDINFGCPVSKIAGRGAGSGMMKDPDKLNLELLIMKII